MHGVPQTSWEELRPYWPDIAKSIIEVFLAGEFVPLHATKARPDGFYAAEVYWRKRESDSKSYPLSEADRFIVALKKKAAFVAAVKRFNAKRNTDWLAESKIPMLRMFLYSCCYQLEDYLANYVEQTTLARRKRPAK